MLIESAFAFVSQAFECEKILQTWEEILGESVKRHLAEEQKNYCFTLFLFLDAGQNVLENLKRIYIPGFCGPRTMQCTIRDPKCADWPRQNRQRWELKKTTPVWCCS